MVFRKAIVKRSAVTSRMEAVVHGQGGGSLIASVFAGMAIRVFTALF